MRAVTAAVKNVLPDNAQRLDRGEAKLAKREENQTRYAAFQRREAGVKSFAQLLRLVDAVMAELEDAFYARKLLSGTWARVQRAPFDFNKYRELVLSIDGHLSDEAWLQNLRDRCAGQCQHFAQFRMLGRVATQELSNPAFGQALVRGATMSSQRTRFRTSLERACTILHRMPVAAAWRPGGREPALPDGGPHLLERQPVRAAHQPAARLRGGSRGAASPLRHARGYPEEPLGPAALGGGHPDMLRDKAWAAEVSQRIAPDFTSASEQIVFELSRRTRLGRQF
jgi:hypothetical protein